MKLRNLIIICTVPFAGCSSSDLKFEENNINSVKIVTGRATNTPDTVLINDTEKIREIVKVLNDNKKETLKFVPNIWLYIDSNNNTQEIAINNDAISVAEGKYTLKSNLENLLKKYLNDSQ